MTIAAKGFKIAALPFKSGRPLPGLRPAMAVFDGLSAISGIGPAVPDVLRGRSGWLAIVCGRQSQAADVAIGQNADNARIIFDCHSESADNDMVGMRDLNRTAVINVDEEALKWFGVNQRFDLFVHRLRPSFGGV